MPSTIQIDNLWTRGKYILIGLSVHSNEKFPLVVGCSMQACNGEIVDVPARMLLSQGYSFWGQECADNLYSDRTFTNRLADTGWVDWDSANLYGSSLKGLDYQDEVIKHNLDKKYKDRSSKIWETLNGDTDIDGWKPFLAE